MQEGNIIHWSQGADGIVVLTLDDPDHAVNTMNAAYDDSMASTVERLEAERANITGVVMTSGKNTFLAGGDLNSLRNLQKADAESAARGFRSGKSLLRRLERLGVPVVAAINGAALGGGLELCLACHHRVIVDNPRAVVGLPEVTLGLLPGAGGIVRTVRMLGISTALDEVLLPGKPLQPARAKELGLVDEIVPTTDDLVPAAKAWIKANPNTKQPWDADYAIPGGTPNSAAVAARLPALPAGVRKQIKGANYPAPLHILAAAVEGAQVDFDTALEIEGRYFVDLVTGQVAKNMIQTFFDQQKVKGDRGRPSAHPSFTATKVVVLGAGMMGAAIGYVCAKAGIEVVLKDLTVEAAQRGKTYSERLVARGVAKGSLTGPAGQRLLDRIAATADAADAAGADLVIEAVFEDPTVKAWVFAEIEPYLAPRAVLGSNTSTLPITGLATSSARPTDFIGLHFFSPVDKMPLIEIIKGEQTSDETLHRALDVAKQIGKTPIVVNDSRGFFTSRVITVVLNEGVAMLAEGIPPATVEQAAAQAGYPAPVLQLMDELNMELAVKIRKETAAAVVAGGGVPAEHPAYAVMDHMIAAGRPGRARGAGFYDYEGGRRERLWPGLHAAFPPVADASAIPLRDLIERLLFAEVLEAVKCLDEGVIESVADANVGSILGIGFPAWTGGVLQYINGYDGGLCGFVARARELAARYSQRFEPTASLLEKMERGEIYTDQRALVPR